MPKRARRRSPRSARPSTSGADARPRAGCLGLRHLRRRAEAAGAGRRARAATGGRPLRTGRTSCDASRAPWWGCPSPTPTSPPPPRRVKDVADGLERAAGPGRRLRAQPDPVGDPQEFFPTSPVIGFANPVAPPVVVEAVDGELRGTAYLRLPVRGAAHVRPRRGDRHGLRRDAGRGQHHGREAPG